MVPSLEVVDVASRKLVRAAVERTKPRAVVLTGGLEDAAECEEDPGRAFALNTEGAIHLAMAALEFGAVPVLISSARVFSAGAHGEGDEPDPTTAYGRSKLQGEQFLTRAAPRSLVVRAGHVLEDGLVMERARLSGPVEAGRGTVSPIGAADLGSLIADLLARDRTGLFHASSAGAPIREVDLWRAVADHVGGVVIESDRSASSALLASKAEALGLVARDWRESLAEAAGREARRIAVPLEVRTRLEPGEARSGRGPVEIEVVSGKLVIEGEGEDRIVKPGRFIVDGPFRAVAVDRSEIVIRGGS
jgi:dTDP-4-dehydrorhamnose reductase